MEKVIVLLVACLIRAISASPLESAAHDSERKLEQEIGDRLEALSTELKELVFVMEQAGEQPGFYRDLERETMDLADAANELEDIEVGIEYDEDQEIVVDENGNIELDVEITDDDEDEEENAILVDGQPGHYQGTDEKRIKEVKNDKKVAKKKKKKVVLKQTGFKKDSKQQKKPETVEISKKKSNKDNKSDKKTQHALIKNEDLGKLCKLRRSAIKDRLANLNGSDADGSEQRPPLITTLKQLTESFERLHESITKQQQALTTQSPTSLVIGPGFKGQVIPQPAIGSNLGSTITVLKPQPIASSSGQQQHQSSSSAGVLDPLVKAAISVQGTAAEALKRILPGGSRNKAAPAASAPSSTFAAAENAAASKSSFF